LEQQSEENNSAAKGVASAESADLPEDLKLYEINLLPTRGVANANGPDD